MDQDAPKAPIEIRLFAGDVIPTLARAQLIEQSDGSYKPLFVGDSLMVPGDGTVPRYSAIADRKAFSEDMAWLSSPVQWDTVTFLPEDHIGLTQSSVFTDNLLFQLLVQRPQRRDH